MKLLILYALIINALGYSLMYVDKKNACNRKWRIPEKVLLGSAMLGGAIGVLIAMETLRHKTKHPLFRFSVIGALIAYTSVFLLIVGSAM